MYTSVAESFYWHLMTNTPLIPQPAVQFDNFTSLQIKSATLKTILQLCNDSKEIALALVHVVIVGPHNTCFRQTFPLSCIVLPKASLTAFKTK